MSYVNAEGALPEDLIREIQKYVDGKVLYIPRKTENLVAWGGHMEPVSVWVRNKGEWAIIHRCKMCGALSSNRVAADDNPMKLMSIAMKPIGHPPFPLERIEEMTRLMGGQGSLK